MRSSGHSVLRLVLSTPLRDKLLSFLQPGLSRQLVLELSLLLAALEHEVRENADSSCQKDATDSDNHSVGLEPGARVRNLVAKPGIEHVIDGLERSDSNPVETKIPLE